MIKYKLPKLVHTTEKTAPMCSSLFILFYIFFSSILSLKHHVFFVSFSFRSCWKTLTRQPALSWPPLNLQTSQTKQRSCFCLTMPPKPKKTCPCLFKISWITFAPWIQTTWQLQTGSSTGTVGDVMVKNQLTLFKSVIEFNPILSCVIVRALTVQVQICVLPPSDLCVLVILCASTLWAPTPVCANMATTMWAPSSELLRLHTQSVTVSFLMLHLILFNETHV